MMAEQKVEKEIAEDIAIMKNITIRLSDALNEMKGHEALVLELLQKQYLDAENVKEEFRYCAGRARQILEIERIRDVKATEKVHNACIEMCEQYTKADEDARRKLLILRAVKAMVGL